MSNTRVLQLYPGPGGERDLDGLYLAHRLHTIGAPDRPMVYGNFVSSLDGRIALTDDDGCSATPDCLTTAGDWHLFQELHAQADCVVTHGAYLRAHAEGRLGNVLQVGLRPESAHLRAWRSGEGLPPQPDIVIASASLEFPIPDSVHAHGQKVIIATGAACDGGRAQAWRDRGFEVLIVGEGRAVRAGALVQVLRGRAYRSVYLLAGPRMLTTMLQDRVLSRLYLTVNHRLVGGQRFHTLLAGDLLGSQGRLKLLSLYYDRGSPGADGQFFACFEPGD